MILKIWLRNVRSDKDLNLGDQNGWYHWIRIKILHGNDFLVEISKNLQILYPMVWPCPLRDGMAPDAMRRPSKHHGVALPIATDAMASPRPTPPMPWHHPDRRQPTPWHHPDRRQPTPWRRVHRLASGLKKYFSKKVLWFQNNLFCTILCLLRGMWPSFAWIRALSESLEPPQIFATLDVFHCIYYRESAHMIVHLQFFYL